MGLTQSRVSAIEAGRDGVTVGVVFRLLAALGLEVVIRPRKRGADNGEDLY